MKETNGIDIFDQLTHADAIVIPTNCSLDENCRNPMGALAGAAAKRWPDLPEVYGDLLLIMPHVPVILGWVDQAAPNETELYRAYQVDFKNGGSFCAVVASPSMHQIGQPASLHLVIRSAQLLVEMATLHNWKEIYMGRVGCGIGGLSYENQVRPELIKIFDDRFTVMEK